MEDATAAQSLPSGNQVNDRQKTAAPMIDHRIPKGWPLMWTTRGSDSLSWVANQGPRSAYETEGYGNDKPAADVASDSPADGAADGRDYDEEYEPRQCDSHYKPLSLLD